MEMHEWKSGAGGFQGGPGCVVADGYAALELVTQSRSRSTFSVNFPGAFLNTESASLPQGEEEPGGGTARLSHTQRFIATHYSLQGELSSSSTKNPLI